MGRPLLESKTSFDPETLNVLCRAFDEAWEDIASNYGGPVAVQERRTRLAEIILQLAGTEAAPPLENIKDTALDIMRFEERPKLHGAQGPP